MTTYSKRILNTPKSFIREILKVTEDDDIISFAGGLPNPVSFPELSLKTSADNVIENSKSKAFQYSTTEGIYELRKYIADRYYKVHNLKVTPEDILITAGSQQCLDLMGKVLINSGDRIILEKPGYLGAIQAFTLYEPDFIQIDLNNDGMDIEKLKSELENGPVKLMYTVPNFQNPTGLTYSMENREEVLRLISKYNVILIEDDPYGELRFEEKSLPYIGTDNINNSVLFGSFSKIISPGIRLGWICTRNKELMEHLVTAKQASDLHTNVFSQLMILDYLKNNDLNEHIAKIRSLYKNQCAAMLAAIGRYFPKDVKVTRPKGGMFIWAELPSGKSSMELFNKSIKKKVAFVPGNPFYTSGDFFSTFRLNYTNSSAQMIEEGIKRISNEM